MQDISPSSLIPMDLFTQDLPIEIALAYAYDAPPNIFGKIYHNHARLWLHERLAAIVVLAAKKAEKEGFTLMLYDGLRSCEAQEKMAQSDIVKANPQWMDEPNRLLSPPGAGAHPRGMAIDCSLKGSDGVLLDMGTVFDHLAEIPTEAHNPAHRNYVHLQDQHRANRERLNGYLTSAAQALEAPLLLLATEWWDFRLPPDISESYRPLADTDLPPEMGMVTGTRRTNEVDDNAKKNKILSKLEQFA